MCPKVIASSLYAISAYESFHRTTLLSDSRGNLYLEHYRVLSKYEYPAYTPSQSHRHTYTPHTMHSSGTCTCYQSRHTQGTRSPGHHSFQPGRPGQDHATHATSKTAFLRSPMESLHRGSFQECLNTQKQSWSQPVLCRWGGAQWPQIQKCFSPFLPIPTGFIQDASQAAASPPSLQPLLCSLCYLNYFKRVLFSPPRLLPMLISLHKSYPLIFSSPFSD